MITISKVSIKEFSIPLGVKPLIVTTNGHKREFTHRNGLYLFVSATDESGNIFTGVGEMVEPVFTLSPSDEPSQILSHAKSIIGDSCRLIRDLKINRKEWVSDMNRLLADVASGRPGLCMSLSLVTYSIEQSILILVSKAHNKPLHDTIHEYVFEKPSTSASQPRSVRLNSMINVRHGEPLSAAIDGCVKLKVGSPNPVADAELLNRIIRNLAESSGVRFRLDANQMWTSEQAIEFAKKLSPESISAIEYIEEPVAADSLRELNEKLEALRSRPEWTGIPIALDESLLIPGIAHSGGGNRIVFKASLHGLKDWKKIFVGLHDKITITCTFETGIGLMFLCALALAVNPSAHHGISTFKPMEIELMTAKLAACIHRDREGLYIDASDVETFFSAG
jgi:hypothetical protein